MNKPTQTFMISFFISTPFNSCLALAPIKYLAVLDQKGGIDKNRLNKLPIKRTILDNNNK